MDFSNEPIPCCPICDVEWDETTNKEAHVAACLGDVPPAPLELEQPTDGGSGHGPEHLVLQQQSTRPNKDQNRTNKRSDKSEVEGTPHLLSHIHQLLLQSFKDRYTRSAILCNPNVLHIRTVSSLTAPGQGDMTWGCGYRNIQMLFSAVRHLESYRTFLIQNPELRVQPSFEPQSSSPRCPSTALNEQVVEIPNTHLWQRIIEAAWRDGFDVAGAKEFSSKLVGKKKWIGTTEAYVAFTSLGIRARIIDFPKPTGPNKRQLGLIDWVRGYFNETSAGDDGLKLMSSPEQAVRMTNKMPLYLQHNGHSRTIVGIEINAQGNGNLLVYDPAKAVPGALKKASRQMIQSGSQPLIGSKPDPHPSSLLSSNTLSTSNLSSSRSNLFSSKQLERAKASTTPREIGFDVRQPSKLLKLFRVSFESLSNHHQYQILCIDSGPLLTPSERQSQKVLKSTRIE